MWAPLCEQDWAWVRTGSKGLFQVLEALLYSPACIVHAGEDRRRIRGPCWFRLKAYLAHHLPVANQVPLGSQTQKNKAYLIPIVVALLHLAILF